MATFAERLKSLRNKRNITLDELATSLYTTKATLSRYENDKRIPNMKFVEKLSMFFSVTPDYLYGLTDDEQGKISKFEDIIGFAEESPQNAKAIRDYIEFLQSQNNKND